MAESENQLELKKRARRRLVGSIALALTAAIVLPMVMDHEPKPLTQDIQIRIPSPDAANISRPATSRAPESDAGKSKPEPESAPAPEAQKPAAKPGEPESSRAEAAKPAPQPPVKSEAKPAATAEPRTEPKPEQKPEAKPEPKVEARAEPKDVAKVQREAKAEREAKVEAILSGNEPAQPGGQFVVQLGAFGDPANVAKVRRRVKESGFSAYTEVVKGPKSDQTRVRAGPFASREAAEQAAAKLKQAGLDGRVAPK